MANLLYRFTMTPQVRTESSIKGSPLTYTELDTNFKLIDQALIALKEGTGIDDNAIGSAKLVDTGVDAGVYGSGKKSVSIEVNDKGQLVDVGEEDIEFAIKKKAISSLATYTTHSAIVSLDDTLPTVTDGEQVMSLQFTPLSNSSTLHVKFTSMGALSQEGSVVLSLFRGSTIIASSATQVGMNSTGHVTRFEVEGEITSGSVSELTISVRVGVTAGTLNLNGNNATRLLGGASKCVLEITEIAT